MSGVSRSDLSWTPGYGSGISWPSNQSIGSSTSDKLSVYGVTPIVQRSGAAQATSLVGTASSADVNTDLKAAIIEVMNTLTAFGIWKGSA
jgi:hypothetical protein